MNTIEICAGVGGWSIGLEAAGFKTVAFCEIDEHCQKVLKHRWPDIAKIIGFAVMEDYKNDLSLQKD